MTPEPSMLSLVQDHLDERRRLGFTPAIPGALLWASPGLLTGPGTAAH